MTAGVQRGFGTDPEQQSYVAVRVGPYYGAVDDNMKGPDDSTIGFNANVSAGIILNQRYFLEARQDWFSGLAGNDFDGLTLAAGVKIFDFGL